MKRVERWRMMLPQSQVIFLVRYVVVTDDRTLYNGFSCCKAWRVFVQAARNGARWACCFADGIEVARFVNGVPAPPCSPTQAEIDARMRALNEAVQRLGVVQASDAKDRAVKALNEAYDWLATHGIDFYYDVEIEAFRV